MPSTLTPDPDTHLKTSLQSPGMQPRLKFVDRTELHPRLATSEAPDAMEEWDVPQMKKEVESLKYQLAFKREMSSKTIPELLKWIEDGIPKDPFLNPDLMKNNPWVEKGKCAIL
ncbi:Guanine nucleotide-binding protein G(I)/G(S)/G(O) subunit gamma-13 [Fukomys damarensis]|uniref:Guanine nucleotide-binding protein G(I)/G(S)/G(O) subunit gamma-13 n=1 Tax=Fukomys damarensis TaxID=885580 RepID=A0A091EH60_FUKDA|nr:Guanine nucleotide-binding protein G(I)/G(S)/G(O) subunit gamma-13 [Fukomys damarensis]